jgi:hypothetical protein
LIIPTAVDAQVAPAGGSPSMSTQATNARHDAVQDKALPRWWKTSADDDAAIDESILWTDLGYALAGSEGAPVLKGKGLLKAGTPAELLLSNAKPLATAVLLVSLSENPTAFKGGVLVPIPTLLEIPTVTTRSGTVDLSFTWPAGFPGATEIFLQYAISDRSAPAMYAISNALKARTLRL